MDHCAVCGETITEINIAISVPQTLEDDLFFCKGSECARVAAIFIRIDGIQQRADQLQAERLRNGWEE